MMRIDKNQGFTLLEMLIALSMSALLVTLSYGALRIGINSWQQSQQHVDEASTMRIGWLFLQQSLQSARNISADSSQKKPYFRGTSSSLDFIADMPSHLGLGGLYKVNMATINKKFTLSRSLFSYNEENLSQKQTAYLGENIDTLNIQYFGVLSDNKAPQWHSHWEDQSQLPQLIKLNVTLDNGRLWPELVAPVQQQINSQFSAKDLTADSWK